jgi:hypothetical protein
VVEVVHPSLAQLDAFVELQVRVEEPPAVTDAGLAVRFVATGSATDVGVSVHARLEPATTATAIQ